MKVVKKDFVRGAQEAEGIVVIIDVFRAFSVACYCLEAGAKCVSPVGEIARAKLLKSYFPDSILVGEREGNKLPGFDFGNSPSELGEVDLTEKQIFHTTHAGTQGIVNASKATEIVRGALVNAKATAEYIKKKNPSLVSLVRMGWKAEEQTDEDNICADYLEALLLDEPFDESSIKGFLLDSECALRFFDPQQKGSPELDFHLCTEVNKFDFAVKVKQEKLEQELIYRLIKVSA